MGKYDIVHYYYTYMHNFIGLETEHCGTAQVNSANLEVIP